MIGVAIAIGLLGAIIGSFLNVVIYRVPRGKSVASPPSACPACGTPITARDNIPVWSWIVLRGRCRACHEPISARYPLVEFGTGIIFFLVALTFLPPALGATTPGDAISAALVLVAYLYIGSVAVALALIDLDVHKLPNVIVLPSYVVGAVLLGAAALISGDFEPLARAAVAMVALALAYFLMALVYPGGMGMGDVKLAGVIGLFLGWIGWGAVFVGAFTAFLLGGIFGLVLMASGRATRKTGIPFGPWMLVGAGLGVVFGSVALTAYLSWFGLAAA